MEGAVLPLSQLASADATRCHWHSTCLCAVPRPLPCSLLSDLQELGITALHIKLRATGGNRQKTPGPGAQSAIRALARSGLKIGRIGELLGRIVLEGLCLPPPAGVLACGGVVGRDMTVLYSLLMPLVM